jgi:hypothetical protein
MMTQGGQAPYVLYQVTLKLRLFPAPTGPKEKARGIAPGPTAPHSPKPCKGDIRVSPRWGLGFPLLRGPGALPRAVT